MPDFDFDAFNHDTPYEGEDSHGHSNQAPVASTGEAEEKTEEKAEEKSEVKTDQPVTHNDIPAVESHSTPASDHPVADSESHEEVDKW